VQIINFMNPLRPQRVHKLVGEALAELTENTGELQVVSAELLVLLKLYAGDAQSQSDIRRLIETNQQLDTTRIAALALTAGLDHVWNDFLRK
jgi:hypothetical protein